jgi:hypothetical protein
MSRHVSLAWRLSAFVNEKNELTREYRPPGPEIHAILRIQIPTAVA